MRLTAICTLCIRVFGNKNKENVPTSLCAVCNRFCDILTTDWRASTMFRVPRKATRITCIFGVVFLGSNERFLVPYLWHGRVVEIFVKNTTGDSIPRWQCLYWKKEQKIGSTQRLVIFTPFLNLTYVSEKEKKYPIRMS